MRKRIENSESLNYEINDGNFNAHDVSMLNHARIQKIFQGGSEG